VAPRELTLEVVDLVPHVHRAARLLVALARGPERSAELGDNLLLLVKDALRLGDIFQAGVILIRKLGELRAAKEELGAEE
jgi:hypothetical protein